MNPNEDDSLAPLRVGPGLVIGYVEEIHGPDSEECAEYRPTRHEVRQLVRHWAKVRLDIALDWFFYEMTGSREIRLGPYADARLARLEEVLGAEAVRQVVAEVEAEQKRTSPGGRRA
jgi:hypothetical protein